MPLCELVEDLVWTRSVRIGTRAGWVAVYPARRGRALTAEIALPLVRVLRPLVARLRRRIELGAFDAFEAQLAELPLEPRRLLVERFGREFEMPHPILTRLPPEARRIAVSSVTELRELGLAAARSRVLLELARTMVAERERRRS